MSIDVDRARAETPGCRERVHLNNAGAALMPVFVVDAVVEHLQLEARFGGYEAARARAATIEHTYDAVARLVGASPHEIALTENATRGWDMVFYAFGFTEGDRIITSRAEYASNAIAMLQTRARTGVDIDVVPNDEHGQVDLDALAQRIDGRVKLIALTHVPTYSGLVSPVAEVGKLARAAGVPFLLDACQSVGQMPIDVDAIGCDALSATGRKFLRGPRGSGFLYVREELLDRLDPPFLDLRAATWSTPDSYEVRGDARRFESWESSAALRIGLGTAVDYAIRWGLDAIEERISELAGHLRDTLHTIDGVTVRDRGVRQCAIVTFDVAGVASSDVAARLEGEHVNVSVSTAEQARLDDSRGNVADLVRASVHYYNTLDELDRASDAIARCAGRAR